MSAAFRDPLIFSNLRQITLLISHLKYGFFVLLLLSLKIFAQQSQGNLLTDSLRFERLGVEQGLPDPRVNCIVQDAQGFMWIGTANGLSRYDGTDFRNFFRQSDQKNSLPGNFITNVINYDSSHILISTTTGLSLLNTRTMEFNNFLDKSSPVMFSRDNYFRVLVADSLGRIWAGTRTTLFCLDRHLRVIKEFRGYSEKDYNKARMTYVHHLYLLPGNNVLAGMEAKPDSGLFCVYSPTADSLQPLSQLAQHAVYPLHSLTKGYVNVDRTGRIYHLSKSFDTLALYDPAKKRWFTSRLNFTNATNTDKYAQITDAGHGMYVCIFSMNGFSILPPASTYKTITSLTLPVILKDKNVYEVKLDREGNLWAGAEDGLYKQVSTSKKIHSQFIRKENFYEWNLFRISFTGNETWVSGENAGAYRINPSTLAQEVQFEWPYDKLGKTVWGTVYPHAGDTLWFSTQAGMRWYHHRSKTFGYLTGIKGKPPSLDSHPVTAIYTDSRGLIWMGLGFGHGVCYYDPVQRAFTHFPSREGNNPLPIRYPISIAEDRSGNLWMGNEDGAGLACWNRETGKFSLITADYFSSFNTAAILYLWCDRKNYLWIATLDGLFRYHIPTQKFFRFDRTQGLPANFINSITEDDKGRIWVGTTNGMSCLFPDTNQVVNFMHPQILPEASITDLRYHPATKKIYFTTLHSVNSFDPEELLQQNSPLFFKVTSVSVGNEEKSPANAYIVPFNENDISISYTAINFADGQLNNYYYRLAGEEWVPVGHQRQINFLNLSPGEYSLSLKAVTAAGVWSNEATLHFIIREPWYKNWWFLSLLMAVAASVITIMIKRRIRAIRHEAEMKQKIAETEMQALRAQMNPHFIFNCINSIDAMIQSNDKYHATMYLNKFAKLIRNILDSSRQNTVPLTKDLETLQLYIELEQFRSENRFTTEINADEILLQDDYKVPPLIVQPYVENAILHGLLQRADNKGRLSISIRRQQDHIEYIIEDNGVGRDPAKRDNYTANRSYGMTMSGNRVKLFNDEDFPSVEITDLNDQGEPAGTRVRVLLKIQ